MLAAGCTCGRNPANESPRDNGEACDDDIQCKSGLCDPVPPAAQKICLGKCSTGCKIGEVCLYVGVDRFGCVPEREGLCSRCADDSDCPYPGDRCIAVSGQKVCGRDCQFEGKCPSGYTCENAFTATGDQAPAQCLPVSGTCECTPATNGQTVPCERMNSFGICIGVKTCQQTKYTECMAAIPMAETCNSMDDDCDGKVDEDLGVITCGRGECRRVVPACSDGGTNVTCTPGGPTPDVCDEKDNDCNDIVDDGIDKQNDPMNCGMCGRTCTAPHAAVTGCDAGSCAIVRCDPGYGDCNAMFPDGCETDLIASNSHCGMCGRRCDLPGTNGMCVAGNCQGTCLPGFIDLDMNPSNGCEYQCTFVSATDLPDLSFTDANCDGIDGEVQNGIFVSQTTGNDSNAGTRASPKRTVQGGLVAASSSGKRDVYVAAGTYTEQVQVPAGRGLYGGYLASTWARATANVSTVTGVLTPLTMTGANNARVQLMTFIGATPVGAGQTAYGAWIANSNGVELEAVTIRSGAGTPGSVGNAGSMGTSGGAGQTGQPGAESSSLACTTDPQPQPGGGGTNPACARTGGAGGTPGNGSNDGNPGQPGTGATPGGQGVPWGRGNTVPGTPYVGGDGAQGAAGAHGVSASGFGAVSAAGYALATATVGLGGLHGNGGGGGGGGGGGDNNCDSYGGAGAGGGAGGCGGTGGFPGMSGGASIGIFLFNSNVTGSGCRIETSNGGDGGRGGFGGAGGIGGAGGVASMGAGNEYGGGSEQDDGSNGARGGRGGNGGRGGDGGGGGGGPSIGVIKGGLSTWTDITTTYVLGLGGAGGASPGGAGTNGLRQNVYP